MIEGAIWRRWVFFYFPLTAFIVALLFPFYWMVVTTVRPDAELYRPWMAPNYTPFWTLHPTLDHIRYLLDETLFSRWMLNTFFISVLATAISLFCGLLAGAEDSLRRHHLGACPRRRVLLGLVDGRRPSRFGAGGADIFFLRRVLRRRHHRIRQGVTGNPPIG